jgi:anti-anti-sigma factor
LKGSVGNEEAKIIQERTMGLLSSEWENPVIIDFSMVGYVSSSGIGAFLELLQKMEQKGIPMRLAGVVPRIRSLFSALGLETYFSFTDPV